MATPAASPSPTPATTSPLRVRIFVDFWNFSLSLREHEDAFRVDWKPVGTLFTKAAANLVDSTAHPVFEGMHVYASVDPAKTADTKLKNWLTNRLDKMPGTHVIVQER